MKLQVLMSVMNQKDHSILNRANINTEAIVVNQTSDYKYEKIKHAGKDVLFINLPEKGVGLSRNNALMRATGDIALFADDDITYVDDYESIVLNAFESNPKADMIIFNVPSTNPDRPSYIIKKQIRIRKFNSMKYATPKIAVRTARLQQANVYFSLLFGGGAKYSSGEDSLFVYDCISGGLKAYTSTETIGHVGQSKSTWFEGFNDKYFVDKGAFFECLSPRYSRLLAFQYVIRKHKKFKNDRSFFELMKLLNEGIRNTSRISRGSNE